ncbi:MAG: hypothetical protein J6K17_07415 [Oscillospiraceae bacterium]|nr:hypothetical protein [Oscillospiraceae bacterium]
MKMKRVAAFTAAMCMLSTVFCSCEKESVETEIIDSISTETILFEPEVTSVEIETAATTEIAEETTAAEQADEEETYLSDEYVEGDYYVESMGRDGKKKYIYYRPAVGDDSAYTYMHDGTDVTHPESLYGYRSFMPQNVTAYEKEFDYGEFLDCMKETTNSFSTQFLLSNGDDWNSFFVDGNEYVKWITDYFCTLEPEYLDVKVKNEDGTILKNTEFEKLGFKFFYTDKINITGVYFCANPNYLYSGANIIFADYRGKYVARIELDSFYDAVKLMESGETPEPEQLAEAYGKSFSSFSDWFYVEDSFVVELMEKSILCGKSNLPQVDKGKNYEEAEESSDISENIRQHFDPDGAADWAYKGNMNGVSFSLPEEPGIPPSDTSLIWKSAEGYMVKITASISPGWLLESSLDEKERYEKLVYEKAQSIHGRISYASYYDKTLESYYDVLGVYAPDGQGYEVECFYKSDERTEEYDHFVKSFLGSFEVNAEQKSNMENAAAIHAPMLLSDTPSRFGNEGYYLAGSYSWLGSDVYKAYTPGVVCADFYAIDYDRKYETGFEAILEKKGEDGLWYEVLPIGEISQANSGTGELPHAIDEARKGVQLDLACYPLLTEGDYRIVKPFWEIGNPETQYGAFYEFKVSEACFKGDPVIVTVETETESYTSDVREIVYSINSDSMFSISSVADIERCDNGVWKSVRKGTVETNSIGGSYALGYAEPLSTDNFDLSVPGEYRIRISVGEVSENLELFTYNYNTAYGYFNIT